MSAPATDRLAQMEARLAKATTLCDQLDQWADDAPTWNGHRMRAGASAEFAAGMSAAAASLREMLPVLKAALKVVEDWDRSDDEWQLARFIDDLRTALLPFTTNGAADGNG